MTVRRKRFLFWPRVLGVLALSVIAFVVVPEAWAADSISMLEFTQSIKAQLSYDPLTQTGYLSKEDRFVSFAVGKPFIALNWSDLKKVGAPTLENGALVVPADFIKEVQGFLNGKSADKPTNYAIAAILVDPGHGGKDTGAIADLDSGRLLEKDITLEVSKRVVQLLKERYPERKIMLTREDDSYPTLEDRVNMANSTALKPDEAIIYVSIHANASFNKNAKGFEVWYLNPEYRRTVVDANTVKEKGDDIAPILNAMLEEEFTTESIILARNVYDRLSATIGKQSPGRGIRAEEWFVVRNAKMPSILIEMGFITNPEEGQLLSQSGYLRKIGDAIYNGIVDFIAYFER
ncbi:MAG TPA: N-acetylmuramoyl-L-alanine amidase [Spirochaetales bacterium]|nr:N-acetylmuramoyl-L-alanine amidase [Spirochaetales bacterium]HOV94468.1 N-acetylmuramoyl-L-alanine amidase [Spirochaetales bacterium]HPS14222.1 N-acetylmuramoyl-L-alanine amidase [Spirochaetales bacterium]